MSNPVIKTILLSKTYRTFWSARKVKALEDLDLEIKQGIIFGFLGPNGAGKTTTIKLLLGLITPTHGSGTIFDIPIGDKRSREHIGFLPDEPSFAGHLRAQEFLEVRPVGGKRSKYEAAVDRDARYHLEPQFQKGFRRIALLERH